MGYSKSEKKGVCELCERDNIYLTVHHLIPRDEGGREYKTIKICQSCHKQIHSIYTNKELAIRLNSIEKLRDDDEIEKFLKWIKKQPSSKAVKVRKSNKIRRRR